MKRVIRILAAVLSLALLMGCLVGCGKTAEPSQPSADQPVQEQPEVQETVNPDGFGGREVKFAVWGFNYDSMTQSEAGRNLLQRLEDLEAKYDCKITVLSIPADISFDAIYKAIAAGDTVCDLIDLPQPLTWVAPLKGGYLVDLNQYGLDMENEKLDTQIMDMITYGDKIYGVSSRDEYYFMNQVCYFNKRLVEEAGYNPEDLYKWQEEGTWTWDKFHEICVKISQLSSGNQKIWGTVQNNSLLYNNLVVSNNTDWFKKSEEGVTFNAGDPNVLEAIDFMKKMYDDGCFPLETTQSDAKLFYSGTVGFLFDYVERVQWPENQQSMTDDYGIIMIPKGPKADTYYSMNNYYGVKAVLKNAPEPEKLAKLIYDFCLPYEDATDPEVMRESFVRDAESMRVFELLPDATIITAQALGSPVREDFQMAIAGQVLPGAETVMTIIDEMQGTYDNALRETWNIPE